MHFHRLLIIFSVLSILLLPMLMAGMSSFRPLRTYKCLRVLDGDTVILKRSAKKIRVRLAYIDAPESKQLAFSGEPIGQWSKNFLDTLCLNKKVSFKFLGQDLYGRSIGVLYQKGINLNLLMVRAGMAFYYGPKTTHFYRISQYQARMRRVGAWASEGALAPWEYRKQMKKIKRLHGR
jgi:micrococcal nuclease